MVVAWTEQGDLYEPVVGPIHAVQLSGVKYQDPNLLKCRAFHDRALAATKDQNQRASFLSQ